MAPNPSRPVGPPFQHVLPKPRGRPPIPSAEEFVKWRRLQAVIKKDGVVKTESDETDTSAIKKHKQHYEPIEYNGKSYHRRCKNVTEDWTTLYLEKLRHEGMRLEEANDDPYKFQTEEMNYEELRYLEKVRMFGAADDEVVLDPLGKDELSPQEDLLNLLYGDIPFDDDDTDMDGKKDAALPATEVRHTLRIRANYGRFYDFCRPLQYDDNLPVYSCREQVYGKLRSFYKMRSNLLLQERGITSVPATGAFFDCLYRNVFYSNLLLQVLRSIADNRVTIIVGCTGSGKTTQIPLYILDECAEAQEPCNIVVTQPRRLAAVSNAFRVASLRNMPNGRQWKLGHLVGFHVGMSKKITRHTRLTFCTTAIFLKTIGSDLNLGRFTHIVLDEVHERDQDTDMCLMLVKKMMLENSPHVKLIIMSATMDFEKIANFFTQSDLSVRPNKIDITQRNSLGTDEYFLDDLWQSTDKNPWPKFDDGEPKIYPKIAAFLVDLVTKLPNQAGDGFVRNGVFLANPKQSSTVGAVLVFLPGMSDIEDFRKLLKKESDRHGRGWEIVILHSILPSDKQQHIMLTPAQDTRRIILSTNIAESSITIPYVVFVIDLGLTKRLIVDRQLDIPRLAVQWTSKANMTQRKGRCGRVRRGAYYCLIPRQFHDKLSEYEEPEMKMAPIHHSLLHVKALSLPTAWKPHHLFALLLDPPARREIDIGILQLKEVGALSLHMDGKVSRDNGEITQLGRILERLPVSISIGRLVVLAYVFGMLDDGITLAAGLSIRNIFLPSASRCSEALLDWKEKLHMYGATESDCLAILFAYEKFYVHQSYLTNLEDEEEWCADNLLSAQRMREMSNARIDLCYRLEEIGLCRPNMFQNTTPFPPAIREDLLRILIAGSFYPLYFRENPIDAQLASNELPYGDPRFSVYFKYLPLYEGPLYEEQLQRILDPLETGAEIPPQILFKDDKAYVNFSRHTFSGQYGICSRVQLVTQSLLRREQRNDMLKVVEPTPYYIDYMKEAEESWKAQNQRVLSSFLFAAVRPHRTPVIPPARSPPYGRREIFVRINNVQSSTRIFIRDHGKEKEFVDFMAELEKYKCRRNVPPALVDARPGDFALATDPEKGAVRRVLIVSVLKRRLFHVFAVDLGRYFNVEEKDMRRIPQSCADVPAFAVEFTFAQLQMRRLLSTEVEKYLRNLLYSSDQQVCKMEVYSLVNSVVHGTLFVNHPVTGDTDVNLNQQLIELGFAYQGVETPLSETMHDKVSDEMMNGPRRVFDVIPDTNAVMTNQKLAINGPFNPVTAKFQPILSQLQGSVVHCSSDSVNSRIMDGDYEHSGIVPRWLVATCAEKAEKADRVVLRNTTVLPRQPGLFGLILALFAPCIQLQSDDPRGYTGAIAGLGFGKGISGSKEIPVYSDHDIRLYFDALLTPSDVESIDDARSLINQMLNLITLTSRALLHNEGRMNVLQTTCRKTVLRLLRRPRKEILAQKFSQSYLWSVETPLWQPVSGTVDTKSDAFRNRVLQPIQAVALKKREELVTLDAMDERLWDLHLSAIGNLVDDGSRLADEVRLECPACRVPLRFRSDIAKHIYSKAHKDTVDKLFKRNAVPQHEWLMDE